MSWSFQELELEHIALWPAGAKLLLLALVLGLLCLTGGYFFIGEHWMQWQQGRQQEAELKLTFNHKTQLAASLPSYQQQVGLQQLQLAIALEQLPNQRQAAQLLGDLSRMAEFNGLNLTGFKWLAERPLVQATELPLQLTLEGDYHQLGQFMAHMLELPRLVIIDGLELRRSPIKSATANNKAVLNSRGQFKQQDEPLNISLSATAYVYLQQDGGRP